MISVIVPVLNEREAIPALMERLKDFAGTCEIIFVDGGSGDGTPDILRENSFTVLNSPEKGRALQMNFGVNASRGDVLWFVHGDSLPPADAPGQIHEILSRGFRAGCFPIRFNSSSPVMTLCGWLSNLRVRLRSIAFGDQGIFIERAFFEKLGGFAPVPLMEDYRLSQDIIAAGQKIGLAKSYIVTSERRFLEGGRLRTLLKMQKLQYLYRKGVSPEILAGLYRTGERKILKSHQTTDGVPRSGRLLFPGCHFPGVYPETTKNLIGRLRERDGIGTLAGCCGKPLMERGNAAGANAALERLRQRLKAAGVTELIVLCPNCWYYLRKRLGTKVTFIYPVLIELGMIEPHDFSDGRIFVPCPDRPSKELLHTLSCCFSGPTAIAGAMPCCRRCVRADWAEAGKLYTCCANCTRMALRLNENVRHILPLLLGTEETPKSAPWNTLHRLAFRYLFNRIPHKS
ncbi:MAG: TIGR04283 family arsenosugar biosynthesis glycosyltransferase [Synergistaceae bacterium]|jgi:rSAM/selenodomain-associated transferase 2|nr:TIGR04283 family arsenosugar biosynthesis glycosyltransferase [Synergistaceae bacterium]